MPPPIVQPIRLLDLPTEIKLQIWEHAFGNTHIPLYADEGRGEVRVFNDFPECEACHNKSPPAPTFTYDCWNDVTAHREPPGRLARVDSAAQIYRERFEQLRICKDIFAEAISVFQSTLTLHIKSPEAIAFMRCCAPRALLNRLTRIVLYVHFNHHNHFQWCMRLFEIQHAFPALKHINIEYHMRPPISYDNLLDVVYFYIPLLALRPPFNRPRYVVKAADRSSATTSLLAGTTIPTCDLRNSCLTFHTAYLRNEPLFEAHFLGLVTTDDAIDEHTAVVRDLFQSAAFVVAADDIVKSNDDLIQDSIRQCYMPRNYPVALLDRQFRDTTHLPAIQRALLSVARRHEKPWFEKLQKRRVVEMYVESAGISQEAAEALLERQLASMPDGHGIEELMESHVMWGNANEEGGSLGPDGGQETEVEGYLEQAEELEQSNDA